MAERPKNYAPQEIEPRWYAEWVARGYFHGDAAAPKAPFAIVIPPPNRTGSLHMGHPLGTTTHENTPRPRHDHRGHLPALAPDGRVQRDVAARHRPRGHRDPAGGRARAAPDREE